MTSVSKENVEMKVFELIRELEAVDGEEKSFRKRPRTRACSSILCHAFLRSERTSDLAILAATTVGE